MARGRRKSSGDAAEPAAASSSGSGSRRHSVAGEAASASDTATASTHKGGRGRSSKKARREEEEAAVPAVVERQEQEQEEEEEDQEEQDPLFFIDREESASAPAAAAPLESVEEEDEDEDEQGGKKQQRQPQMKKKDKAKRSKKGAGAKEDGEEEEQGEEEALLERLVFGRVDAAELFAPGGGGGGEGEGEGAGEGEGGDDWAAAGRTPSLSLRPAWEDADDAAVRVDIAGKDRLRKLRRAPEERDVSGAEYQERLRARFEGANKAALSWAALPDDEAKGEARTGRGRRRRRSGSTSGSDDEEAEAESEEEDNDDALFTGLFQSSAPLVGGKGRQQRGRGRLQPGTLEVLRCRDANLQEPSQAVVQALQFHPTQCGLLLTAGFDKTLRLFQADGKRNEKRAGVFFPDLPIQSAAFVDPSGGGDFSEVVVSGRRPFFYWYDTVTGATGKVGGLLGREERSLERFTASPDGKWLAFTGKDGYILLASARTKQWAGEFKMNGTARALCFSHDGAHLLASGGDAVVYRWDLRSRRCLARFRNEGGTVTSALAHGPGAITAVGAESGVVNLYDDADTLLSPSSSWSSSQQPPPAPEWDARPLKALPNLTTAADSLCFNHDGQLLAMASRWKRDALRMVHVPSRTVFSNWPTGQTPIRYASAVGFSPNSGLLAVGNDRGRVLLYRLRHYDAQ